MAVTYEEFQRAQSDVSLFQSSVASFQIKVLDIQKDIETLKADLASPNPVNTPNTLANAEKALVNAQTNLDDTNSKLASAQATVNEFYSGVTKEAETKEKAGTTKNSSAPSATDPTKAPVTSDGDRTGDNNFKTTASSTSAKSTSNTTPNAGTTAAGAAGNNSTSSDPASIIGKRTNNPLGDFSSYTYKIALYMMNPEEFNAYMSGDYTKVSGFNLIAQSGGINNSVDSPRAPGFDLDLYIDDLEIRTVITSKETLSATNSTDFKFKIYEPYGFSLPHKLVQAQIAAQKGRATSSGSAAKEIYALTESFLLTIKFYGYDKDGKLVTSTDYPQADISKSDSQSVFERGFPIRIKDFKFKLENKVTVYSITAIPASDLVAKGVNHGTLPTNITLAGKTIQDVLVGEGQTTTKKSIMGLVQSLNAAEKEKNKNYSHEYAIEFESGSTFGDARLVPKDYYVKERTPFDSIHNPDGSNVRKAWNNRLANIDKEIRTIELQAGTSIIQAIDRVITQSEYLKNMMTAVDKEIVQPVQDTESTIDKNSNPKTLSWYNISNTIKIISDQKDPDTNNYAYKITYKIQEYQIPYIRSVYTSKTSSYYGPHKTYNYWYTGKNTEILSYEQDYNLLYTVDAALSSAVATKNTQSATVVKRTGINIDSDNSKSGTNDVINSIKSFLYSPGDLIKFKLKILGDPDYLMPSVGLAGTNGLEKWYGDNFTINPNSGQVFIEIYFEQAEDYNNTNGLLVPNSDITFMSYPPELKDKVKGMVYMLKEVISTFSKGKFEQSLTGLIPEFANTQKGAANAATSASPPPSTNVNPRTVNGTVAAEANSSVIYTQNQTQAETNRLLSKIPAGSQDDNPGYTVDTTGQGLPEVQGRPRAGE